MWVRWVLLSSDRQRSVTAMILPGDWISDDLRFVYQRPELVLVVVVLRRHFEQQHPRFR